MKCRLPKILPCGLNEKNLYGTKFTFAKTVFSEEQMIEKLKNVRSPAWVLCEDDDYWYMIHDERLTNIRMQQERK